MELRPQPLTLQRTVPTMYWKTQPPQRFRASWLVHLPLFIALLVVTPAGANTPESAAEALFRSGRAAVEAGDYAAACARFRESLRLEHATGTLLNLAICEEELGQLSSAWQRYRKVLEELAVKDERRTLVERKLSTLELRLPFVILRPSADTPAATRVYYRGTQLTMSASGVPLPMDPGHHVLIVKAPGRRDKRIEYVLGEGQKRTIEVSAESAQKPPRLRISSEGRTRAVAEPSEARRDAAYWFAAAGTASLLASLVSTLFIAEQSRITDRECNPAGACTAKGIRAADRGQRLESLRTVSTAVGITALGASAYLWFTAPAAGIDATNARSIGVAFRK